MDSVPLTAEAIAFTEKKMDMTLEDIIKMSKKKPAGKKAPRQQVKKRPFQNGNSKQGNAKVQRFHESRSSIRQGVLAQRRSNLDGNQFQVTKQAANKAATMPVRGRADRWNKPSGPSTSAQRRPVSEALQNSKGKEMQNEPPRTMDALFAQMKQQRMRIMPPPQSNATHGHQFNKKPSRHSPFFVPCSHRRRCAPSPSPPFLSRHQAHHCCYSPIRRRRQCRTPLASGDSTGGEGGPADPGWHSAARVSWRRRCEEGDRGWRSCGCGLSPPWATPRSTRGSAPTGLPSSTQVHVCFAVPTTSALETKEESERPPAHAQGAPRPKCAGSRVAVLASPQVRLDVTGRTVSYSSHNDSAWRRCHLLEEHQTVVLAFVHLREEDNPS